MNYNKQFKLIFKNSFWLGVSEVVSKLVGFLIGIWMARRFGPDLYGKWSFALAFVTIFSVVADFGLSTLSVRELARNKEKTKDYFLNITLLKFILGALSLGLMALIINLIEEDPETISLVYFLGIYIVINTFAAFFESIFRAREKMKYEAICRVSQSVLLFSLAVFFIFNGFPILNISFAYISGSLLGTVLALVFVLRYFYPLKKTEASNGFAFSRFFDLKFCKELLLEAWPFALSTVAIFLYNYFDQTMLGVMRGDKEVGLYSAAFKVVFTFQVFGDVLAVAFFPQLSKKYKEGVKSLKEIFYHFQKIMLVFVVPFTILLFVFALPILRFLYGSEYTAASNVFQVLVLSIAILLLSFPFGETLKAADRQKSYLWAIGSGAILNVVLNFIFIPRFGMMGAAINTLISEIYIFIFLKIKLKKLWKELESRNSSSINL